MEFQGIHLRPGDQLRRKRSDANHPSFNDAGGTPAPSIFEREDTSAFRLINAEGDGIPGLIVDRYDSILAVQFTTLGMDNLRDWVVEVLRALCKPSGIFEKSGGSSRKKEGMVDKEGWIWGGGDTSIPVTERGMQCIITLSGSQKTGLFLDQREMRSLVRSVAKDRTVLDCCSYVGGFSLAALLGVPLPPMPSTTMRKRLQQRRPTWR